MGIMHGHTYHPVRAQRFRMPESSRCQHGDEVHQRCEGPFARGVAWCGKVALGACGRTRWVAKATIGKQHSAPSCWYTIMPAAARSTPSVDHTIPNTGPGGHQSGSFRSANPLPADFLQAGVC